MKSNSRVVKLGRDIQPCLKRGLQHELDFMIGRTITLSNSEPSRAEEFDGRLLSYINELVNYQSEDRERIDILISEYYAKQSARRSYPIWLCKIREAIMKRK